MGSFSNYFQIITLFFSVYSQLFCAHYVLLPVFTHEAPTRDSMTDRGHSDFSHDGTRSDFGGHGLSVRANNFEKYTPQGFQHHFA